jgi:hypothetical protein
MAYEDLLKDTSVISEDGNYFTLTITDLEPNTSYPIELRWKYKDGTFSGWSAVRRLPAYNLAPEPSELPSTPTVKPVVGAIELAWNGKTSTGEDQPYGFNSAKVYIGTTSNFTPVDSGTSKNLVDILNFANGQNTLNIGVETIVNSSLTLDYGVDYFVKIKTTNGNTAQDSVAVSATGNPVRIGQLDNDGLVTISADKIITGTLRAGASITAGAVNGKRVILSSGENPIQVYGSGGTLDPLFRLDSLGNLVIKGVITATSGAFTGAISINGVGGSMKIGQDVDPTAAFDGIYIGTNNYWYNDGTFKVGSTSNYISWDSATSKLQLTGDIKLLSTTTADNIQILTSEPNVIKFESPQSLFNVAGFISNVTTSSATTMKLSPSSRVSWANNPFISIENSGLASDPFGTSVIKMESYSMQIKSQTTVNIVTRGSSTAVDGSAGSTSVRNIWFNNVAPTSGQGLVGDVWMQYA